MIDKTCGSQGVSEDGRCRRCGLEPDGEVDCPPAFFDLRASAIPHTEPGCGGLWRGDRETGVIRCTLCGAEHPGTPDNQADAIRENRRTIRQEGTR